MRHPPAATRHPPPLAARCESADHGREHRSAHGVHHDADRLATRAVPVPPPPPPPPPPAAPAASAAARPPPTTPTKSCRRSLDPADRDRFVALLERIAHPTAR
ncbi:hypothetical protein ACFT5C_22345 [Streptomyces sp. NPDC057116]|uniref:hypothetical protein n=1 Tax=Streptomyces sp. NPDC057116 TaxID=3346023 RepID=UPI003634A875